MTFESSFMSGDDKNLDKMYDAANQQKEDGDLEGAVAALKQVLEIDANHLHTNMALGVYLQKLGRLDEAIVHAVKVTEIEPEDPFSFTQLSVIYQRCGKIQEAEDAMARAHVLQGRPPGGGH
jgi:Flp pilus assembly protein TadD